jgi:L-fuconolactonase
MKALAAHANVYCKISGMVTEADWRNWTAADLFPYIDIVVQAFGTNRCMFGSDWPVCLVAAAYDKWLQTVQSYFASFSAEEQANVFAGNAKHFYQIDTL